MVVLNIDICRCISARNNALNRLETFNLFSLSFAIDFKGFDIFAGEMFPIFDISLFLCIYCLNVIFDSFVAPEVFQGAQILPGIWNRGRELALLLTIWLFKVTHYADDYSPAT